jgi:energy-coupling factor transport system permease protein
MWSNAAHPFHVGAWLLWLAAAMIAVLTTRNPVYLSCVIVIAGLVYVTLARTPETAPVPGERPATGVNGPLPVPAGRVERSRGLLLRAVVGLTLVVTLLKGLSLHLGTTVLFRLPEAWPVIGGPITLESMVSSALDALSILAVLAVFAAFSAGADYYAMLRSLPPFLHQVGLITSIAITFVPQTVTRFAEIREAMALRGHRIRRVSDLVPLVMPLLSGGMERSMNLAEAMESRGFSRKSGENIHKLPPVVIQSGIATGIGLMLVGGALLAFASTIPVIGWFTIVAGAGVLSLTMWAVGLGKGRTRIRRNRWYERDTLLAALSAGFLAFFVTYRVLAPSALVYYPFPGLHAPYIDVLVLATLLLLLAPVFLYQGRAWGRIAPRRTRIQPWKKQ